MLGLSRPSVCGLLVPRPGIKPLSLALQGRLLTTEPSGNSLRECFVLARDANSSYENSDTVFARAKLGYCSMEIIARCSLLVNPDSVADLFSGCPLCDRQNAAYHQTPLCFINGCIFCYIDRDSISYCEILYRHEVYSGKTPTPPKPHSVASSTALGREQAHHEWFSSQCTINGASLCQPQPFKSYFLAGGVKHEAIAFLLNDKKAQSEGRWPLYSFKQLNLSQPEQSSTFTCEPEFGCHICMHNVLKSLLYNVYFYVSSKWNHWRANLIFKSVLKHLPSKNVRVKR